MAGGTVALYQALYAWAPPCAPHSVCPPAHSARHPGRHSHLRPRRNRRLHPRNPPRRSHQSPRPGRLRQHLHHQHRHRAASINSRQLTVDSKQRVPHLHRSFIAVKVGIDPPIYSLLSPFMRPGAPGLDFETWDSTPIPAPICYFHSLRLFTPKSPPSRSEDHHPHA